MEQAALKIIDVVINESNKMIQEQQQRQQSSLVPLRTGGNGLK